MCFLLDVTAHSLSSLSAPHGTVVQLNSSSSSRARWWTSDCPQLIHPSFLRGLPPGLEWRTQGQSNDCSSSPLATGLPMCEPQSLVGFPSPYAHPVVDGSQCCSAVSLLMSNHEFLDVNLLASLLNDTEFVMIIVLLTSHLLWHHLFSEGFFLKKKKKENDYSALFSFQMASIISLILLQMLYENFRM